MPKLQFTQTLVVLFDGPINLESLLPYLQDYRKGNIWPEGHGDGPSLLIEYLPEVNGSVMVDVLNRPWPDHLGGGAGKEEATLLFQWTIGRWGPFSYPGGLMRAMGNNPPHIVDKAKRHNAMVRIRSSYVMGLKSSAPPVPENYDSFAELNFITDIASAILSHPQALAYFNPSGETLFDKQLLDSKRDYNRSKNIPNIDIWSSIRIYDVDDKCSMMDIVGNSQLDMIDHEMCFPKGKFQLGEVCIFILNIS